MENHQINHPNSGVVIHPLSRKRQNKRCSGKKCALSCFFLGGGGIHSGKQYAMKHPLFWMVFTRKDRWFYMATLVEQKVCPVPSSFHRDCILED